MSLVVVQDDAHVVAGARAMMRYRRAKTSDYSPNPAVGGASGNSWGYGNGSGSNPSLSATGKTSGGGGGGGGGVILPTNPSVSRSSENYGVKTIYQTPGSNGGSGNAGAGKPPGNMSYLTPGGPPKKVRVYDLFTSHRNHEFCHSHQMNDMNM